jgi:hypothetical protein
LKPFKNVDLSSKNRSLTSKNDLKLDMAQHFARSSKITGVGTPLSRPWASCGSG